MFRARSAPWLLRGTFGILLSVVFANPSGAGPIYEFRAAGVSAAVYGTGVLGTLEFKQPPATNSAAWSTSSASDVVTLLLDDSVFRLGTGNLTGNISGLIPIASFNGLRLDAGGIGLAFPTIVPSNPGEPRIDRAGSMHRA